MADDQALYSSKFNSLPEGATVILRPYLGSNAADLANGGGQPNTPIQALAATRTLNQQWVVVPGPSGGVQFKNAQSNTFLGVQTGIQAQALVSGQYQPLEFTVYRGNKANKISPIGNNTLRLDYKNRSTTPPVDVWLYQANETDAQEWIIELIA